MSGIKLENRIAQRIKQNTSGSAWKCNIRFLVARLELCLFSSFRFQIGRVFLLTAFFFSFIGLHGLSYAEEQRFVHGRSVTGELKYPFGFSNFDYVNIAAPKAGEVRLASLGKFDNLNLAIDKALLPSYISLVYDRLMVSSSDEIFSSYALVAKGLRYPEDISWVEFKIDDRAYFHDGEPIGVDDVIFSFESLMANHYFFQNYYIDVQGARDMGDNIVRFDLKVNNNKELPSIIGQLPILPKHWWTEKDEQGNLRRDISKTILDELPLGSGPYRISKVDGLQGITYQRVKDYWGQDINVNVGKYNFDKISIDYYGDDALIVQALKAGVVDYRAESIARNWTEAYNGEHVETGDLIKLKIPTYGFGRMSGFAFNLRRSLFSDYRVRLALNYAYDFEAINRSLFYGQYSRIDSFFFGSDLASHGLPSDGEVKILDEIYASLSLEQKHLMPRSIWQQAYSNPKTGRKNLRGNLKKAKLLLEDAGVKFADGLAVMPDGSPFSFEFLVDSQSQIRHLNLYKSQLARLGISMKIRVVEPVQYKKRLDGRNFDGVVFSKSQSLWPGNEQVDYWSSEAADNNGSGNIFGIKNLAIDKLIKKIVLVKNRQELLLLVKSLDRVLLANNYVVPNYTIDYHRLVFWNKFSRPSNLPKGVVGFLTLWWYDQEKVDGLE